MFRNRPGEFTRQWEILQGSRATREKKVGGAPLSVGENGDPEGSDRPDRTNAKHSLKTTPRGIQPRRFKRFIVLFFVGRYLETPPLEIHLPRPSYWACEIMN